MSSTDHGHPHVRLPRSSSRRSRSKFCRPFAACFDSGTLILGPRVQGVRENFCRCLGRPAMAIGVGNGTDALAIALRALDIGPGDEVLTVANTAIPDRQRHPHGRRHAGVLRHRSADAAARSRRRRKPRSRRAPRPSIPVHLFGNAVDMPAVLEFAGPASRLARGRRLCPDLRHDLAGQPTGTFGDVGCFSFYPTKNLGAYGDGGLCFTRDAAAGRGDAADSRVWLWPRPITPSAKG